MSQTTQVLQGFAVQRWYLNLATLYERKGVLPDLPSFVGLLQLLPTVPRQKLSEALVIAMATKSSFHTFPLHNGFLRITQVIASSRLSESCGHGEPE